MIQKGGENAKRKWGEIERGMRGKMRKRKGKKRREGEKENKEKGKEFVGRKKGKGERRKRKREDFPAFGWSKFDSSRTKVGAHSALYVWTPKSWSFDNFHEVGYFPTWFILA